MSERGGRKREIKRERDTQVCLGSEPKAVVWGRDAGVSPSPGDLWRYCPEALRVPEFPVVRRK